MPRKIPKPRWGCDFKCGRVCSDKKWIEKHEQTCFKNPARRACKTCKHDVKGRIDEESNDCYCALDFGKPEDETLRRYDSNSITCRVDCPAWEPKDRT